jgi:long-chain acyl-CoA synthetase
MPSTPDKLCLRFEGQEWTYGHERVVAAVVRVDPGLTAEKKFCRRDLAGYKEPRGVVFVDALSRSALGKVLKHEVRDQPSESEE